MRYCSNCRKKLDKEEERCPDCGALLREMPPDADDEMQESKAAEIISTMTITGIL